MCEKLSDIFKIINLYEISKRAAKQVESSYQIPEPKKFEHKFIEIRTEKYNASDLEKLAKYGLDSQEFASIHKECSEKRR